MEHWLRGHIKIIFFVFIVCLLAVPVGSKGKVTGRATCESTGLGEQARVTCFYRENVVEAGDVSDVSLLRDAGGKQEKVVECHRFRNNGFDCLPKTGYTLKGTISDQMIINIPRARPEHQGTYYCEIGTQQTEFQMDSCGLGYEEPDDAATFTPPSEQDNDNQLREDTGTSNATASLIAVTVILLLVIAVLVLFVCRRHQRRRNRGRQQDTDADNLGIVASLNPASNVCDGNVPGVEWKPSCAEHISGSTYYSTGWVTESRRPLHQCRKPRKRYFTE